MIEFTKMPGSTIYRGTMILKYPGPIDIPGQPYCHVLPRQPQVLMLLEAERRRLVAHGQPSPERGDCG